MNILQVVPNITAEANGVTPVVQGISKVASEAGNRVAIASLGVHTIDPRVEFWACNKWNFSGRFEFSPDFWKHLSFAGKNFHIIHNHSLWSACNILSGLVPRPMAKLVVSPHGTLTQAALERRGTLKNILKPIQWRALEKADLLHATAESEIDDILRLGLRKPIALIPNGVDVPSTPLSSKNELSTLKRMLFLSRLHPIKGIENLLKSWINLQHVHSDWCLDIVGIGDSNYEFALKNLAKTWDLKNVHFQGPLYGAEKDKAYRNADIFILPSHSENFGMVVAEALAQGCPAIVSKGAPWAELEKFAAGWWTEIDVPTLTDTMDRAMKLSTLARKDMGANGHEWMRRDFSWEVIAKKYLHAYQWVAGVDMNKPNFIVN